MDFKCIIFEKKGPIVTITLNRPDQLNALDAVTYSELYESTLIIEADKEIKVLVIKGNGRAFCSGADIKSMQSSLQKVTSAVEFLQTCHRTYNAIESLRVPTIAAVHGMALGGGIELLESCDIVIASESAKIGDQHAARGFIAGGGSTQRLIRQMGYRKALELLLTGDWMTAIEAEKHGLINKAVPDDQLDAAVDEMAQKLAKRSSVASKTIKMLAKQGVETDLSTGLLMEIMSVSGHMFTDDFREGVQSFMERREPNFPGT